MNSRGPRGGRKLLCSYAGRSKLARVAELADAQASGACARKGVRVQVPPRAHKFLRVLAGLSWMTQSGVELRHTGLLTHLFNFHLRGHLRNVTVALLCLNHQQNR